MQIVAKYVVIVKFDVVSIYVCDVNNIVRRKKGKNERYLETTLNYYLGYFFRSRSSYSSSDIKKSVEHCWIFH